MIASSKVVLVPGAGLGGLELALLARRLRRSGWKVRVFYGQPARRALAETATELRRFSEALDADALHYVAHSLGGLVVLKMLADWPDARPGRVVTMGTPHLGTEAGRRWARLPGGRWLLGRGVVEGNESAPLTLPRERQVGAVAGRLSLGLGWLLGAPSPSDSVVGVAETCQEGLADHLVLPVTHAGLLVSRRAAEAADRFLRQGRFGG